MSIFRRREWVPKTASDYLADGRNVRTAPLGATTEQAMRHSAVWGALRLRADIISTLPVDTYRRKGFAGDTFAVNTPTPAILVEPSPGVHITEWLYSSQVDLDRYGNAFGHITDKGNDGRPARIELAAASTVNVRIVDGALEYRFGGVKMDPAEVWHERQYTVGGLPVGLSPIAYAAWTIGGYLSAQQFASEWFNGGATPGAHFRNTKQTLKAPEADAVKARVKATLTSGDVLVTGNDWEWNAISAKASEAAFLDSMNASVLDVCRFMGVPADSIDAALPGSTITYANVTQRALQLLVTNIGPAVVRREHALTRLAPAGQHVKLNTNALLRMDPQTSAQTVKTQIEARTLTPDEARALDNRRPLTPEQVAQFAELFPKRGTDAPTGGTT